ncbi:MAG: GTPase HflX [Acidimicrobiaceae bacterium]|nr:GTPase HflX [Acidimicrobiaceae bacterium]
MDVDQPNSARNISTHRGGFGEFSGDGASSGLIDRSFRERIILVALSKDRDNKTAEASLDELSLLVDTAGADTVARAYQYRNKPDPATFIGIGKVHEIHDIAEEIDCDTVVFDDELTPAQQHNLEKILGRSAIDRTAVILDIFAQNARTPEGKAQVELAQLRYLLPRLRGKGKQLSQQAGGIGTRGPGETKLETDRRRLQKRVNKLEQRLEDIARHRRVQSKSRRRTRNQSTALVGYTNAGKSSLLNRLTSASVVVEDRLFATLDPTTRRLPLPGGEVVLMTDTVGFISKLPHHLVQAFKTTLDVVRDADLLLHVVDAAGPNPRKAMKAVREVLYEIGAADIPELVVFNKSDLRTVNETSVQYSGHTEKTVSVSALTGEGVTALIEAVANELRSASQLVELEIPWARGDVLASVHREGRILSETATEQGMHLLARLDEASIEVLRQYKIESR